MSCWYWNRHLAANAKARTTDSGWSAFTCSTGMGSALRASVGKTDDRPVPLGVVKPT